jgi:gamma-tubulin complex component 3
MQSKSFPDSSNVASILASTPMKKEHKQDELVEPELLQELLFAYQNIDGKWIRWSQDRYVVAEQAHISPSMRALLQRLLELATLVKRVRALSVTMKSVTEGGLMLQSFCCAIESEVHGYYQFVSSLESQFKTNVKQFTLHRVLVWVDHVVHRFRTILIIAESCKDFKGGALLNQLHTCIDHGDPVVHDIAARLFNETAKPFFEILSLWLREGRLQDQYHEFFIQQVDQFEDFWRDKYVFSESNVPRFLSSGVIAKVLQIGIDNDLSCRLDLQHWKELRLCSPEWTISGGARCSL